jgi:flagellar hook-basal body complex protein FliE
MSISGISSFTPTTQGALNLGEQAGGIAQGGQGDFGAKLSQYVQEVNQTHHEGVLKSTALVTGQGGSMTEAMLAMQKSEVNFQLLASARNKMIDSYREIMRMPV